MRLEFYKFQATGNDFVIIDHTSKRRLIDPTKNLIAHLCHRRFGIGADGVMILEPSDTHAFKMVYYNADGGLSTMCGNGGRAISMLAYQLGIIQQVDRFLATDGEHKVKIIDSEQVALQMNSVHEIRTYHNDLMLDTGSPHYVRFMKTVDGLDIIPLAHEISYNDDFADQGINVNFVAVKDGILQVRTYERGVEDETYSCGTGVTAAAIAARHRIKDFYDSTEIRVVTKGGNLHVLSNKTNDSFDNIWLVGPTEMVYHGIIEL